MTGRATGRLGTAILAVEDEARNAALLRAILGPAGYDLTIAASLAEARAAVGARTPALVLLDRHLPDGDGLSLARELRASETTAAIPILLVSASVLPVDRIAAEEAGCAGFIDKPVRVDALLAEIARHLAKG
ncbi:MAG: multi-sensor hybrid histidine kinase [Chloroflexota bacterium]|jgi:two-component system KDP operon response regulator KdpE|nr:multi-sensor hybrid histidine kinase [Chloroflexota bacterium]